MRAGIFSILLLAAVVSAKAGEIFPVLQAAGQTYSNVMVTTVSATDVYFTYTGGMGNVKIKTLSPGLQKHFNFDPKKAREAEIKQADNKVKYHEQLLHQPAAKPPDMARDPDATAAAQKPAGGQSLASLLHQAQTENKLVLLDFTGSDWCPWCVKFDEEVLSTAKFAAYAGQKLKFVKVDFLRHTPQPEDIKKSNTALSNMFKVDGFPTYVLLDSSGKELGRQVGYQPGGPDAFIAELDGFSRR